MSIFKCKMCGGSLEIANGTTVIECEYCGTKQTLPKLDDDKRANMYDRANHFRRNNEYDKAMGIYEQILNEDNTDAEAYWSLVLCRYGIEYVEDPTSHKRIPTVNRAQFTSIFDDDNYKSALEYADSYQRTVYEEEAKAINEIQKGILAISQKEEPFDVFICYKETDSSGRRTHDSVLANDLYHQLTQEGFKVFFARITLEDKLGSAYEPYIFAALNSAKVMVVLGTKPEFFNAVWVKNEWSRYLSLIKQGQQKMLIPAYKDMDPYDLPEEFSHLQAQDMSKLGFMQDLIRGIKKIAKTDEPVQTTVVKETVVTAGEAAANTAPLLKRAFMFLEDGDFKSANSYCEKVLDVEPENAQAYLGKLMAELGVRREENLKNCANSFENRNNYLKTVRFGDEALKNKLEGYIAFILERNENARLEGIYDKADKTMEEAESEWEFEEAAELFESISHHKDSKERAQKCREKAEITRKDDILEDAEDYIDNFDSEDFEAYEQAISLLEEIPGWKNSDELKLACEKKIEEIKAKIEAERIELERQAEEERKERERQAEIARKEAEKRAKLTKKIALITTPIVCAVIAFVIVLNTVIIPNNKYNAAIALMDEGKYTEAIAAFEALEGYKDSAEKAEFVFVECKKEKLQSAEVGDYIEFGKYEQDNNTSNGQENIEWLVLDKKDGKILVISKYALDCKKYNATLTGVTWENCSLRNWLNDDFINSAFPENEKNMIPTVTVSADKNPGYSANPGKATQDQVFLLSITEVNKYFDSVSARQCKPTEYAIENGVLESDSGNCWWCLRSPGGNQSRAARVGIAGGVDEFGNYVDYDGSAVRPALWIDLNS